MSSKVSRIRILVIGFASVFAVLMFFSVPATSASFVSSAHAEMGVDTPEFGMELLDGDGVSSLRLDYPGLTPGVVGVDHFTVKNIGQVDARVKFTGFDIEADAFLGLSAEQARMLTMSIEDYQPTVPVAALSGHIDLGTLKAGQSRTYALRIGLDRRAGSEWQYRALAIGGIEVALVQS